MKNLKFLYVIGLIIFIMMIIPAYVLAQENSSFIVKSISDNSYELNYKIVNSFSDSDKNAYSGKKLSKYILGNYSAKKDGNTVIGHYEWENPNYVIKKGEQTVTLLFKTESGEIVKAELELYGIDWISPDSDGPSEPTADPTTEEQYPDPSLTAASIIMNKGNTYDININDKVDGSYTWTSSNEKVAKVNSKNGVVTAVSNGTTKITCRITSEDGQTYNLTSNVTIGTDDNFITLNNDILDLSIGDKYDLNVENQITKSKYQYKSSDRTIATVNSTNGIVIAKGEGTTDIYCTIISPDKQIIILKCEVNITK